MMEEVYVHALDLIRSAGMLVKANLVRRDKHVETKEGGRTDVVTETDKAVEKMFIEGIKKKYPDHRFIGEESMAESKAKDVGKLTDEPTWIIDPIDGTLNFVHNNPLVGISVALCVSRKLEMAFIFLPALDMMYTARRGKGAMLNGRPIKVSDCGSLCDALIIHEMWAGTDDEVVAWHAAVAKALMPNTHSVRDFGSAAVNLAFVAAGMADGYNHVGIHCWDFAAGALIVKEAGGAVVDPRDGRTDFDLMSRGILVACNSTVAKELATLLEREAPAPYHKYPRDHEDVVNAL